MNNYTTYVKCLESKNAQTSHAGVAFTMGTYSHIINRMQKEAMTLLEEELSPVMPGTSKERQSGEP